MNSDKPGKSPIDNSQVRSTVTPCTMAHICEQVSGPEAFRRARSLLTRRSFVKTFALFSAASWTAGNELSSLLVAELSAQSVNLPGIFRMNLDSFPALQQEVGSVRLSVTGMPTSFRQIIVSRLEGDQFFAVTSQCTHEGQTVNAMNLSTRRLICPAHGSQFEPDGTRISGQATRNLTSYPATFDGVKTLSIEIPNLGFTVVVGSAVVPGNNQKRVRLEFPTVTGVRYGVRFRPSLNNGAWTSVPFSTTIDGAATLTTLNGNNAKATVFVEPSSQSGFYAVIRGA